MNKDFPRIITFLRRERGLSQKQAAKDLGISQSLLSHYEKGIRECGLDFLIRAADYYEVSADYLLGRTVQRSTITANDLPDTDDFRHLNGNMINRINHRLLTNTTTICIYEAGNENPQNMFSLDQKRYKNLTTAAMLLDLEIADAIAEREKLALSLSPDIISGYFEKGASSLFNLIQFAERNVRNHNRSGNE